MKKLAVLAALTVMSMSAWAQVATVALNNFDADKPIFAIGGAPAPVNQEYYVQLFGAATGAALAAVGEPILIADFPGYFDGGVGVVPNVAPGGQADLELRAWKGAGGLSAATEVGSVSWSQATGTWNNQLVPPPPPTGASLAIPSNIQIAIIPEPSTIALGLLGAAALLIRRRK